MTKDTGGMESDDREKNLKEQCGDEEMRLRGGN